MSTRHIVLIVIAACVLFLVAVEIVALFSPEPHDTITDITREYSRKYPMIPLLWGILTAHLFWWQGEAP
jgi:Na+-driven multidrug efflux pump